MIYIILKKILPVFCCILLGSTNICLYASEKTDVYSLQNAYARIAEKAFPAVVVILSLKDNGNTFVPESSGSGFCIDQAGYILTNLHVIDSADALVVQLYDKTLLPAKVVGYCENADLALLKVSGNTALPALKFSDTKNLKVGHYAIAIGAPLQLSHSMTVGIISHKGRRLGLHEKENFIQTDAAINPGNSGGPLLNIDGEVIGVNNCIIGKHSSGLNFAIDGNLAKKFADRILAMQINGVPYLGVTLVDSDNAVKISHVNPDSPAAKAGLKLNDIIIKIDQRQINSSSYAKRVIYSYYSPGESATFHVKRNNKIYTFPIRFESTKRK